METPTLTEIFLRDAEIGGFYFSRTTLAYFGQTKRSFKVHQVRDRIFVYAPANHERWPMGYTIAEYFPATGKTIGATIYNLWTIQTDTQAIDAIDAYCA